MEGFLHIRIAPWLRRLVTRSLAIVPALFVIHATRGKNTVGLLVLSQVVLSMQLPFAIFPLVAFTSDRERMGRYANNALVKGLGYALAAVITVLNVWLIDTTAGPWWVVGGFATLLAFALYTRLIYRPRAA